MFTVIKQPGRLGRLAILIVTTITCISCTSEPGSAPPKAERQAHVDTVHGDVRTDYYYWLRNRHAPEVLEYLKAENEYAEAQTAHTEALQDTLYQEMIARINETDTTVPVQKDDYYYYTREEAGNQYDIHCRKHGSLDAPEEIILDINQLAEGYDFYDVGAFSVSPDHELLAYSVDTTGREIYTLHVKDLTTGEVFPERVDSVADRVLWAGDNRTLFYTIQDDILRPAWVYRHRLGGDPAEDDMLIHEPDEAFGIWLWKTSSEDYLVAHFASNETSEVRVLRADQPDGKFETVFPRETGVEYEIEHQADRFLVKINKDAKNFKVVSTPTHNPSLKNASVVVPHRDSVKIDHHEVFSDYFVLFTRENGLRQIEVYDNAAEDSYRLEMPEPIYTVYPTFDTEYESNVLRYKYNSMTTPTTVYDYNLAARESEVRKVDKVGGGFDSDHYQSERIFATAADGTEIPISLVYRKGFERDGTAPLQLVAYGAYGVSSEPSFSRYRISLLDRGFAYARAHVRGGGEMGRYWYDQGKLLNKMNTFTDFIACAEHLIEQQYTSAGNISIGGGSAGGMLIGAAVNMRPDLFLAAVADVPFVDVVNTMLDESIPLTVVEYEEWGNPNEEEYYDYMMQYSPYDNVTAQEYPAMLVLAGLNDPRVQYWEPAKWVAKLRHHKTDDNLLLLKTNMGTGHMGSSGRYDYVEEIAFEYAFILDQFGMNE